MKKWYALVGILATVMAISLGTCSIQMDEADRYMAKWQNAENELSSKSDLVDSMEQQLSEMELELAQLKATGKLKFGEGLRIFDVSLPEPGYFWGTASGKVQNTSDEPMEKVMILVASYDEDGSLEDVSLATVSDLYPEEIGEWECWPGGGATYDVYAFGNR